MAFAAMSPAHRQAQERRRNLGVRLPKQERAPLSMNILLVKSALGKPRPPVYNLPGPDHVYGMKVVKNIEDSAQLATQGFFNVAPPVKLRMQTFDYVASNRVAAKQGITSAKGVREFHKSHPVFLKTGGDHRSCKVRAEQPRRGGGGKLPSDRDPSYTYGKPTNSSTPVRALLTDVFTQEWAEQQRAKRERREERERARRQRPRMMAKMLQRRPQPKRKSAVEAEPSALFRMKRFADVARRVQTRWPAGEEDSAYGRIAAEARGRRKAAREAEKGTPAAPPPQPPAAALEEKVGGPPLEGERESREQTAAASCSAAASAAERHRAEQVSAKPEPEQLHQQQPQQRRPRTTASGDAASAAALAAAAYRQRPAGKPNEMSWNVREGISILCWD